MEENKGSAEVVDRKEGYYWVRFNTDSEWTTAYYCGTTHPWWNIFGMEDSYYDREIFEIDERQICRS